MPGQAKLEDSNVANLGGEDHKNAVKDVAALAAEWKGAGAEPGIQIWRIEKFQVVKWPERKFGTFFSGDSFIVLHTYKKPDSEGLLFNVHFWLGKSTSQDEAGTAAYKTVELDTLLGDVPVQYRECQGYESNTFLKLFNGSVRYLDGGVDSGFNHVEAKSYQPRLMHFTGKKHIRVSEVPLATSSLNSGDVFLLDNGLQLIQWHGSSSGAKERRKAQEISRDIRSDRLGKATLEVIDEGDDHDVFWTLLGGKGPIAAATPDVDVKTPEPVLFQLSNASGSLVSSPVPCEASSLDSNDVFILDLGFQLYTWIGSGANRAERNGAMKQATIFLQNSGRPLHTPVTRIVEGGTIPKAFTKAL